MNPSRHARGFTLIELLVATAIFGVLATLLFQMVKSGLGVWTSGEGRREELEKGTALLDEIATDLRMAAAEPAPGAQAPDVRMLADFGLFDLDLEGPEESLLQRLRFVRACPEERQDPRLRGAGDVPGGVEASSDTGLVPGAGGAPRLPPGGFAEVAYATVRRPAKGADPALLSLVRMFRAPIGGDASLLDSPLFDHPGDLLDQGVVLADNVLHLGFEFWSRDTTSFDEPRGSAQAALATWDSTRGTLAEGVGPRRFALAKGPGSRAFPDDDVFPRRVRVTLVVARDADEQRVVRLREAMKPTGSFVPVDTTRGFAAEAFVKVGGEWMRCLEVGLSELKVTRGERGTAPMPHAEGAVVHAGAEFQRVVELPSWREDWNDP